MDQTQRESDLKALRKMRDVLEEGYIGRALVLVNRAIQAKAIILSDAQLRARISREETAEQKVDPYAKTGAPRIASEKEAEERWTAIKLAEMEAAEKENQTRRGEKEQTDES